MSDLEVMHPRAGAELRADDEHHVMPDEPEVVNSDRRPASRDRAHDLGQLLRGMLAGVILAALVALGIDNRQQIAVGYVFDDGTVRLWVLLAIAAGAGMVFGWLVAFRSHRTK
jgi:hypothetical protein